MKYRMKPVVIEALQFTRNNWDELVAFTNGKASNITKSMILDDAFLCKVSTLWGNVTAAEGDYIIRGVCGEFYLCKPEHFDKTYEPADVTIKDMNGKMVQVGDIVVFNQPEYRVLDSSVVLDVVPDGIKVNYHTLHGDSAETVIGEKQFVIIGTEGE